jgi:hypothetical protein
LCRRGAPGVALALVLLATPGLGRAYDEIKLTPSISFEQRWESNVFNRESDERDDFVTFAQPQLELRYDSDRTRIRTSYLLQSRSYADYSGLNSIGHRLKFDGSRNLTRRLSASLGGALRISPKTDDFDVDGLGFRRGRPDYRTYSLSGSLRYSLDARSAISLGLVHARQDYEADSDNPGIQTDTESRSITLSYTRTLSRRDSVGLSLARSDTEFQRDPDTFVRPVFETLSGEIRAEVPECREGFVDALEPEFTPFFNPTTGLYNRPCASLRIDDLGSTNSVQHSLSVNWARTWGTTWRSGLRIGVRRLESEGDSKTAFVSPDSSVTETFSQSDSSVSMTGSFSLTRSTDVSTLSFSYLRETRPASNRSANVDIDFLTIAYDRRLTHRLRGLVRSTWTRQQSVSDLQAIDDQVWRLVGQLQWRWTEDLSTFVRIGYRTQSAQSRISNATEYDKYSIGIGFQYKFPLYLL